MKWVRTTSARDRTYQPSVDSRAMIRSCTQMGIIRIRGGLQVKALIQQECFWDTDTATIVVIVAQLDAHPAQVSSLLTLSMLRASVTIVALQDGTTVGKSPHVIPNYAARFMMPMISDAYRVIQETRRNKMHARMLQARLEQCSVGLLHLV